MKAILSLALLLSSSLLSAQLFREVLPDLPFAKSEVEIDYADVDGDGDLDLFVVDISRDNDNLYSQLYFNDGLGNFTEAPSSFFPKVWKASATFMEVNGDGKVDLVVIGPDLGSSESMVHINDGNGNFTRDTRTSLPSLYGYAMDYADVDNDNDLDLMIAGREDTTWVAYLYLNDGTGKFTPKVGTPSEPFFNIEPVFHGSVDFADINGDANPDILITGTDSTRGITNPLGITRLYVNDGQGNFTEANVGVDFEGVKYGKGEFIDVNNDGSQDIFIHGWLGGGIDSFAIKLYINDGAGNFSYFSQTDLEPLEVVKSTFEDFDGDQDTDLFLSGIRGDQKVTILYENDGTGFFRKDLSRPIIPDIFGSIYCMDINGDGHKDFLASGRNSTWAYTSRMYLNDGANNFADETGTSMEGLDGTIDYADFNGDGSIDVLLSGSNGNDHGVAKIFLNDSTGNFYEMPNNSFDVSGYYKIVIGDTDADGDQDIFIAGNSGPWTLKQFINDGTGEFTEGLFNFGQNDEINRNSLLALEDVDGNNHLDLVFIAFDSSYAPLSRIFLNDGQGNFQRSLIAPFPAVFNGSIDFADIDGDSDTDMVLAGLYPGSYYNELDEVITNIYLNDGMGNFAKVRNSRLPGMQEGNVAFADVDGNGSEDILLCGVDYLLQEVVKLYLNDGQGNFTEKRDVDFSYHSPPGLFEDIDGNGTQDLLMQERWRGLVYYSNDGQGNFTDMGNISNYEVHVYHAGLSDLSGNGKPDLITTGTGKRTRLFMNEVWTTSVKPESPPLDFLVYPNPTSSKMVEIEFESLASHEIHLRIYDLQGRLLHLESQKINPSQQSFSLNLSSLSSGSYLIQLDDGKRSGVRKLLVH